MKTNDITTIEDLRDYLTEYCAQNPEDDCIDLIQEICEANGWKWCDDLEGYDDMDYATDGDKLLSATPEGWHVFDDENLVGYNGYKVEQSISGYWRLMKDGEVIYDDPACEDLNEDEETARAFFNEYLKNN